MDNLKPEEADLIMRELKKGSIGGAMLALGYFNPDIIGGYYQPGEKRKAKDVKAGEIRVDGHDIPSYLLHNPLLETLQVGATIRRVSDSKFKKSDREKEGLGYGVLAGAIGVTEQTPIIRETEDIGRLLNPRTRQSFAGQHVASYLVPQALSQIATATDTKPRKPRTIGEHIKSQIPGLREEVPTR